MSSDSKFEASASALGYAYQFRYSLHRALEKIQTTGLDWSISIESADDVEIIDGAGRELRQLKLRKEGVQLTDYSTDLWKTLRIWSDGIFKKTIVTSETTLYLITTAELTPDSAGYFLQPDEAKRDINKAKECLDTAAKKTKNQELKKAVEAYGKLTDQTKLDLLNSVHVLAKSDDNDAVLERIKKFFRVGTRGNHLDYIMQRLEGWWFQQCMDCMAGKRDGINAADLDAFTMELRDQLRPDNLPIDSAIASELQVDLDKFFDRIFYHQLSWASISAKRIQTAVRDYLRAYTQRSQWLRHGLVLPGEIDQFERRLVEEWEIVFDRIADEISPEAAEAEKIAAAKEVYRWVEQAFPAPIRPNCTEPFVTRGSYHLLADEQRVGWHPEYVAKLIALLEPVSESV
ncbi:MULTISPECIES: ABC-three component system protein [Actinosynnema]|uniref:ABC-three component system protein n=1 Tax=Actinosynnema TaxID=40566 RepID=UPI0020A5D9CC|nr:ABC-three component system protein [Actinosynnema pretiosum]MCP2093796.1 hypothetical protein [Actinosynnema pretiosum]